MVKKKINVKKLNKELKHLNGDFRAEVIASELSNNGIDKEVIVFKANSLFKRFVSKDVEKYSIKLSETNEEELERLIFELNREGIYDVLPQNFFHFNTFKNTSRPIDEIKKNRIQQQQARKFFAPIENEFFASRFGLEIKERSILDIEENYFNREIFEHIFDLKNETNFDDKQIAELVNLLPMVSVIRNKIELIEFLLQKILKKKIEIVQKNRNFKLTMQTLQPILADCVLGVNLICGNSFASCNTEYDLYVFNIDLLEYPEYCLNGLKHKLIIFLLPYLFDVNCKINIHLQSKKEDSNLVVFDINKLSYLGFNSYI